MEQANRKTKREDLRAGLVWSAIQNLFRGKEDEPIQPFDCFPHHQREADTYEYRRERRRSQVAQLNALKLRATQEARKAKGGNDG